MNEETIATKVVVLAVHGMGRTDTNFHHGLRKRLKRALKKTTWDQMVFDSIYYQNVLQDNQDAIWFAMDDAHWLTWKKTRKFVLFGFSDAAGLERHAETANSPYEKVQAKIKEKLICIYKQIGQHPVPIVVIAQSLGGHVISNYIWDAQQNRGLWKRRGKGGIDKTASNREEQSDLDSFLRLCTLRKLYTTGCNIPIFVSAFPKDEIEPIVTKDEHYDICWTNIFDRSDVLGWPLQPINAAYSKAVANDRQVNVGGPLSFWNPLSHKHYWKSKKVIEMLARDIEAVVE